MAMQRKPNVLVLGASGGVANALLQLLPDYRAEIGTLVLLDKQADVIDSGFIEHGPLRYIFIEHTIDPARLDHNIATICATYAINILLDVTDLSTSPLLRFAQAADVGYINTMLNGDTATVVEVFEQLVAVRDSFGGTPHLLCSGMNPGVVNVWVMQAIERFGKPLRICFFEHDTSVPLVACAPHITWSRKEFLEEAVVEPSGRIGDDGAFEMLLPNAISHLADMTPLLEPIKALEAYPHGIVTIHEEVLSLGSSLKVPAEFVYAVHPRTLSYLRSQYRAHRHIAEDELVLADNVDVPLEGSDLVGVWLDYDDKKVCYYNEYFNSDAIGTNATYTQVAVGVLAGLRAMIHLQVPAGLNFPEDITSPIFRATLAMHMLVQEKVLAHGDAGAPALEVSFSLL